jgi:hypothetical protein
MPIDEAIDPVTRRAAVLILKTVDFAAALKRIPGVPDAQTCDGGGSGLPAAGNDPKLPAGQIVHPAHATTRR